MCAKTTYSSVIFMFTPRYSSMQYVNTHKVRPAVTTTFVPSVIPLYHQSRLIAMAVAFLLMFTLPNAQQCPPVSHQRQNHGIQHRPFPSERHHQHHQHHRYHQHHQHHQPSFLLAKLSVCTHEDCIQQGAYQTLAKLKKEAKDQGVQVDSCPCLGMCGLGPCVSIDWDGSRMESRGGIDASDDVTIRQIVGDASKPPPASKMPTTQERDPYAEQ